MIRSSIKEAFGGEVPFTGFIAEDKDTATRLLKAVDVDDISFEITPEEHTVDRKRVDLVVRDQEGSVIQVIESQDASGWLDSVHSSKIMYYAYEKECMDAILITEDATEHMKGFVKWINENTPVNLYLVAALIYKNGSERFVDFLPIMRPFSMKEKRISVKSTEDSSKQTQHYESHRAVFDANPGMFDRAAKYYCSKNNLGIKRINVDLQIKATKVLIRVNPGKPNTQDNDLLKDTVLEYVNTLGPETEIQCTTFNKYYATLEFKNTQDALKYYPGVVDAVSSGKISA